MVRGLLSIGGIVFLAAAIALTYGLQRSGALDVFGFFRPMPTIDDAFQRGFRSDAMSRINAIRGTMDVHTVGGDEEIQAYLNEWVGRHPDPESIDLDDVFATLQERFPGAQYLAANLVTSSDRENLLGKMAGWSSVGNSDFDSINTAVFRSRWRIGALGVMSRRIPEFSLAAANSEGGRFHNRCPHCGKIHALEIDRDSRTLILSCPYCDLPFDVLAVDTEGSIRRAPDFLDGFRIGEHTGAATRMTPEQRIIALWGAVADRCDYELDQDRTETRESWKYPRQTWDEAAGDCEDTSILLADVLIGAGFDARVAIGWNGNIGQHAWVVVRAGEKQYVLESTLQSSIDASSLNPVEEAGAFYKPEQLFDDRRIYYTTARPDRFTQDYFSAEVWKPIPREDPGLSEPILSTISSGR